MIKNNTNNLKQIQNIFLYIKYHFILNKNYNNFSNTELNKINFIINIFLNQYIKFL